MLNLVQLKIHFQNFTHWSHKTILHTKPSKTCKPLNIILILITITYCISKDICGKPHSTLKSWFQSIGYFTSI